ncbi:MAG: autotransporter assembly complex protein TamA, partial [Stenotrophobium sp.]
MRLRALALLLFGIFPALAQAGVDVRVRGLDDDETDNVYAQIGLLDYAKKTDAEKGEYDANEVQRQFAQGNQDIRAALQPFGWYNPVIKSELRGAMPDWTAIYTVDPGPATDVTKIDIQTSGEGKDDTALQKIVKRPWLHTGERLQHARYERLKNRLQQAALAGGYLDASFTRRELRVDVSNNTAEILLTLETGPRYYFGAVTIEQDGSLDDAFLRRYLTIAPGEPFDASKVLATQFNFTDLGYFQTVDIETQKDKAGPDRRIPLLIRTTPKKRQVFRLGAGYGTDTGLRALAGVEFRQLNEEGHTLRIELRPSQNISTAIADYRIPSGTHPGDSVSFTGQGLKQNFQGIDEKLFSLGNAYERQLGVWSRRYYLTYTHDDYTLPGQPPQTSLLLTPGITVSRTELNDP